MRIRADISGISVGQPLKSVRNWILFAVAVAAALGGEVSSAIGDTPQKSAKETPTKIAKKTDDAIRSSDSPETGNEALREAIDVATQARDAAKALTGYSARFSKQEWIGRGLISQQMDVKLRHEPFSVYMKFVDGNAGREVLYVANQNKGNLLVHEGGIRSIAGTFTFAPTAKEVMNENHHPVTKMGIQALADQVIDQWKSELKLEGISVVRRPNVRWGEMECEMIETVAARPAPGIRFAKTCLYIEKNTGLPIGVQQFAFPRTPGAELPLFESYLYTQIRPSDRLTDVDFDRRNRQYRF